jgi:hypothetical protein
VFDAVEEDVGGVVVGFLSDKDRLPNSLSIRSGGELRCLIDISEETEIPNKKFFFYLNCCVCVGSVFFSLVLRERSV